ncbi:MAG TPA: PHB depolymerase family esterase [Candidatus Competibacter sp.]|nr:PHB depolymerase family esterase [Candidatus Competibacter sp.]
MQKPIMALALALLLVGCQDTPRSARNYPPPDYQRRAERLGPYDGARSPYERRLERRALRAQENQAGREPASVQSWNDKSPIFSRPYPRTMAGPGDLRNVPPPTMADSFEEDSPAGFPRRAERRGFARPDAARAFPQRGQMPEFSEDGSMDEWPRGGGRGGFARAEDSRAALQRGPAAERSGADLTEEAPRGGGPRAFARADEEDWAFGQQGRGFGSPLGGDTALPPGFKTVTLSHAGRERSYLLYVPASLPKGQPAPLVMVFHGGGGHAAGIVRATNLHQIAERHGFIAAYPNGTGAQQGRRLSWNAGSSPPRGYAENQNVDDVGFVKAILQQLKRSYSIDPRRIYATGLSKGGMFAYRLGCELSDQIAAIAPVAGSLTYAQCRPSRAVAILHIHGGNDQNVPLEGGRGAYSAQMADYPSALRGLDQWRQRNNCTATPTQTTVTADTKRFSYQGCKNGGDVTYYVVRGGGHGWPGSTPNARQQGRGIYLSNQLKASEEIWKFFAAHPKP